MATYTGTNGDDTTTGTSGDDTINAKNGDDTVDGGDGDDTLLGGGGDDTLTGGSGDDFIHGGTGTDTAVFSGSVTQYTWRREGANLYVTGPDGVDRLIHIEFLQFDDALIQVGVNNAPIALADTAALTEDDGGYSSGASSVLDNDFDWEGNALSVTPGVFEGTYGTLTMNADGTYDYVLKPNAQTLAQGSLAQDVFNYTVSDGSASSMGTLTFEISGLNDAPAANADAASTGENSAVLIDVLANDTDIDNGAVLTVTAASAPKGSASVVGNQVEFDPGSDFDHLAVGASEVVIVSYTIEDEHGASSSSTIEVTVTGTNDGPVANADAASTDENSAVLIDVLANDTDADDGAVLTVTAASAPKGSASVVGNQVEFDPGADFDHLAVGASEIVIVSYTIEDEHGASSNSTIEVTVTGTNDGPVANPDAASTGENAAVLIDVLANDTDADDGAVLTVTAASAPKGSASVVGNQVEFDPGADFDHLAVGASEIVTVSYTIEDEHGASSSSTIEVTVTGTNDGPVANADAASTDENSAVLIDVLANDTDVDDGAILTVTAASAPKGSASVVGNQVEFDPGADFDHLSVGQTEIVTVSYTIEDEHGASSNSTIEVTVEGANDGVTIDAGGTTATGSVNELPNNDPDENAFTHQAGGTVAFDDPDLADVHSATATAQGGGYVGTFTLDAVDQGGDSVGWNFEVDDSAIDFLADGETLIQTYTIEISDGNGGTATQDVTVTITGAADGPQTEWYIDNSAVGSANLGTQADPFTSIAAFNAAQGTVGGPQVGATVYLLAGTGTYAEADGINLLDDQVLTGVADGPLRPAIVTVGGANHGVELAQNNTVSGIDIGDTTGAGISDGNGSVGSLTVSDVGVSGLGQILDIDQGGTLNVSLNSAASLASTGGAIDLDGVGGTVTIGAVDIAGVHSGGGVDITGSTAAFTLAGGTISTGDATAVNFSGNSGSLLLSGGLDIVTTTGTGLSAGGGGMIAATGANTIAAAGGTALAVSGTTIDAVGLSFESISAIGGTNAIVLQNTGALGGLTITGTGSAGSGGILSGTTGHAIVATSTQGLNLSWIEIVNPGGNAISATELGGANMLFHSTISGFAGANDGIRIVNAATELQSFTVFDSTFSGGATGNDAILLVMDGGADMTLRVLDSTFTGLFGDAIQAAGTNLATGTMNVTVSDSAFLNAAAFGNGGVSLTPFGAMTLNALIENSTFDEVMRPITNVGAVNVVSGGGATANVTIRGNTIEDLPGGRGINAVADSGILNLLIDDNSVDQLGSTSKHGISVVFTGTASGDVIVSNNAVGQNGNLWTSGNGSGNGILLQTQNNAVMEALLDGNTVTGNASFELVRVRAINASSIDATVSNNVLTDALGSHVELDVTAGLSTGTAVIDLSVLGNVLPGGGVGVIRLTDLAGGVLNVAQASAADVSAQNGGATIVQSGTVVYGQPAPSTPTAPALPPAPMMAVSVGTGEAAGEPLSQATLDYFVAAAIQGWREAGATSEQLAAMESATVRVSDLSGLDLGLTEGGTIRIDADAAGHGWSVGGAGGMDLLAVLLHEFGHVAGLGDEYDEAGGLMYGFLAAGEQRSAEFGSLTPGALSLELGSSHGMAILDAQFIGFDVPAQPAAIFALYG